MASEPESLAMVMPGRRGWSPLPLLSEAVRPLLSSKKSQGWMLAASLKVMNVPPVLRMAASRPGWEKESGGARKPNETRMPRDPALLI